ncbi:hypothetical protein ACJRO7_028394 [Eucalyptus globulus]|uniref:Peptidase A1 domain-containing protein n=1 Tax=Eucalyptus globulus TaxID=34317 RepID=A0ABD3K783_EUCGL
MAAPSLPSLLLLSSLLLLLAASPPPSASAAASRGSFLKLPLLHRPSRTPQLLRRGRSRSAASPVTSAAPFGAGQYLVALHLGTPPQRLLLVADTGSDLVWARCSACRGAGCSRRAPGSAFLARRSSSFRPHHCYSASCRLVPRPSPPPRCNRTRLHSACRYEYTYSDGSLSSGFFARETVSLHTTSAKTKAAAARLKGLAFGCGFRVSGPSVTGSSFNGSQGVMGLGRGPISFASQLGRRFGSNKFSYCLKDYTLLPSPTSYLIIGDRPSADNAAAASPLAFTPLLANPLAPSFYYVGIKRVSVDGERLPIDPSVWSLDDLGNGGTILDSGTTLTFLAEPGYRPLLAAMRRRVGLPAAAAAAPGFDLCVNVTGAGRRPRLPRLSFEMEGGAVLAPPAGNYFIDVAKGVRCLAVRPAGAAAEGGGFSVIGNVMQQGFLWEFDVDRSRLGFSRRGCAAS